MRGWSEGRRPPAEQARTWWERFGFRPLAPDEPDQLDLYLPTSEIDATLCRMR